MFNSFKFDYLHAKRILHVQYLVFPPEFCSWTEIRLKRYLYHLKKAGRTNAEIIFGVIAALLGRVTQHTYSVVKRAFQAC